MIADYFLARHEVSEEGLKHCRYSRRRLTAALHLSGA